MQRARAAAQQRVVHDHRPRSTRSSPCSPQCTTTSRSALRARRGLRQHHAGEHRLLLVPDELGRVRRHAEPVQCRVEHAVPDEELPGDRVKRLGAAPASPLVSRAARIRSRMTDPGRRLQVQGYGGRGRDGFCRSVRNRSDRRCARCREVRWNAFPYLAVLPAALFVIMLLMVLPIGETIYHSFTNWDGLTSTFIGLENFRLIFQNPMSTQVFLNSVIFLISVPLILAASVVTAVLVYEQALGLARVPVPVLHPRRPVTGDRRRPVQHVLPAVRAGRQGARPDRPRPPSPGCPIRGRRGWW